MSCLDICSFIISIGLSIITLIFAILTFKVNKKAKDIADSMEKRDIDRYNKEIDVKAREFISKYNKRKTILNTAEIDKLKLCIMAYIFNPIYSYRNSLYTDFNNLSDDVKTRVLEIRQLTDFNIKSLYNYEYLYDKMLSLVKDKYKDLINIIEKDFDNTLIEIYLQTEQIDKTEVIKYIQMVVKAFESNNFDDIIQLFSNTTISQNTLRFVLCIITQEVVKYSISKSDRTEFESLSSSGVNYIYGKLDFEDLFLDTLLTWYICIEKI